MRRLIAVLVVVLFASGCASSAKPKELNDRVNTSGRYSGIGLIPPLPRPAFTLTDTAGKTFAFGSRTAGRPTLLFFGYTNCPDVCPTTMADVANALSDVPTGVREKTYVVFVTTDPAHDTGPVLQKWLTAFSKGNEQRFIGLTGSQAQIDAAQAAAHITIAEDGGQTHSAQVLLYGADDYARVNFVQSTGERDQIAHDLPLVA